LSSGKTVPTSGVFDAHDEDHQTILWDRAKNGTKFCVVGLTGTRNATGAALTAQINVPTSGNNLGYITVDPTRVYEVEVSFLASNEGSTDAEEMKRKPADALAGATPATFEMGGYVGKNQVPFYVYEYNTRDQWWVGEGSDWGKKIEEGPISWNMLYDRKVEAGFPIKWINEKPTGACEKGSEPCGT
jgi:hypothetical protein